MSLCLVGDASGVGLERAGLPDLESGALSAGLVVDCDTSAGLSFVV